MRYLLIAVLLLGGCRGIDGVKAESTVNVRGPHDVAVLAGPTVTYSSGWEVGVQIGRRFGAFWPGEPRVSSRAPRPGWQGVLKASKSIFKRRR